jgi:Zn finger protein HypA/HybF involved in hydrogenase expression
VLTALLGPPLAALLAGLLLGQRDVRPASAIALNTVSPGAGLAALGRPTLEVVLCVLMAQASLLIAGTMGSIGFFLPFMVVGGVWASVHTPYSPFELAATDRRSPGDGRRVAPAEPDREPDTTAASASQSSTSGHDVEVDSGYAVEVRCTECGADLSVPVLHHMASCEFCGSNHLVVGREQTLQLTLVDRAATEAELKEVLLDHYRYQHYLKLFRASVPLVQVGATEATSTGVLVTRPEAEAAAAAAEAAITRRADAFRARLAPELQLGRTQRFLSPYRHGMGTLYQATFGRRKTDQEKGLAFRIGTVEASASATAALTLPEMGKLTYLRALRPAASRGSDERALALDLDEQALERAFGNLDRKQLDRTMSSIRLGSRFSHEVNAVVWRPWWTVEVSGPGIQDHLLVDGASGSVAGAAPIVDASLLGELPESARDPGRGLTFVPMECPTCGDEFPFDTDAVLHFCHNCHRLCRVDGRRKREIEYSRADDDNRLSNLVPFWLFPLQIRTASGELVTDLAYFKDGIDGTFDQIGDDHPMRQHGLYVPAIRCINSRLMSEAFNRLFHHTIRARYQIRHERYPLDTTPRPWSVHMDEPEARRLVPLYLANAFDRRDLARVKARQVTDWLFDATQEVEGRLVYLPVPEVVTNPFSRYVGRFRGQALQAATAGAD